MKKALPVVIVAVILWVILASMDAGLLGFGVVLSAVAFFDIVTGEFKGSSKLIWLVVILISFIIAVFGIAFKGPSASPSPGSNPAYMLATVISILLSVAYFLVGRKERLRGR